MAVLCSSLLFASATSARSQETEPSSTITFKTLLSFDYTDGAVPTFGPIQGIDGNFYGTTNKGGTGLNYGCNTSCGTVFEISPAGKLTTVHNFDGIDGNGPFGLVQATDGSFYGTTTYGGANDCTSYGSTGSCGTIFKITSGDKLTTLHNFCSQKNCTDGAIPWGGLVQATDGNFYGTTVAGGVGGCKGSVGPGCGTVFKITTGGKVTTLHSFDETHGAYPYSGLVQASNGNFYGTTYQGGSYGDGTVFEITPGGTLTTLHNFDGTDGAYPFGALVQATNGNFYGTTSGLPLSGTGGPSCTGSRIGWGTVFEINAGGKLTTLHSFADTDGAYPFSGLAQATDGNFYGLTACSGAKTAGTIFKITPSGTLTTLHSFDGTDGSFPFVGLTQATNGNFYGITAEGGTDNFGTIFSLSVGLGPFVETRLTSGAVGAAVEILGNSLTGATSVTFNGFAATFKVVSSSEITTTVPASATTGMVKVKTPSGTLSSNIVFRVMPSISSFSPTDGPVGTSVEINGESLAGATSITFGGVNATKFTVDSDTKITATLPEGAKTGEIGVTTAGGTATSSETFTVN